jgi:SAM-dependent methyltransferase
MLSEARHPHTREMDEALEEAVEQGWRAVAEIDRAYANGELDDDAWHRRMAELIVPAYLSAATAEAGSGHSGTPEEWEWSRSVIADALPEGATFLDVGCANGLLMESAHRWRRVEPYGLEISPELASVARRRYPDWADRIWVGNALGWEPPQRFGVVRTALDYVPQRRRRELVEHLLSRVVLPGGRLVVGKFNELRSGASLEETVASWGFRVAGRAERAHRREPRIVYRAFWIDADQAR